MSVNIHGKEYRTVAERINLFYSTYKDKITAITTEIIKDEDDIVQVKATISAKDSVENPTFYVFGNGYAEEDRTKGRINSTSALENCETSAIGRALASIGLGGEEYASANEVQNAIHQQDQSTNGTITKDDGSQFPQQQPKRNQDLLNGKVEEAKKQMNGESNGGVDPSEFRQLMDTEIPFSGKNEGKLVSKVAPKTLQWYIDNMDLDRWDGLKQCMEDWIA